MLHLALRGAYRPRLCRDVFGIFDAGRGDNANRRIFQPRIYGSAHTGTERRVHLEMTGVRYVQMGFVVVAHWPPSKKGPQGYTDQGAQPHGGNMLSPLGDQHIKSVSSVCGSFV